MIYVIDACVAVAGARSNEPMHKAALLYIERALSGTDELIVPSLFRVEVASALTRVGCPPKDTRSYVRGLITKPHTVVSLNRKSAREIQSIAIGLKLRAADATYVWLAARENVPLVTSDHEIIERASAVCKVISL